MSFIVKSSVSISSVVLGLILSLLLCINNASALGTSKLGLQEGGRIVLSIASRAAAKAAATPLLRDYFNYIYLSTLFNKPIATLGYETYCTDYPDEGWAEILQVGRGISIDYWRPQCVPVKVQLTAVDPKAKTRLWNASVQYLNFPGSSEFVRKIKKAIVDPESINLPLLNQRRQIELPALYDLKINYFQHYGAEGPFKDRLVELLSRLGTEFKLDDNTGNTLSVIILRK